MKGDCTFLFRKFLIFGLCNSCANSLLDIFSFPIAPLANLFRVTHPAKNFDHAAVAEVS